MATTRTRRVIEIDVTTSKGVQSGVRQINAQLRSMESSAKRTQREVTRMSRGFNLFSTAAKVFIALRVARAITDISDEMTLLSARLNIVASETVGVDKAFEDLVDLANSTRQSLAATGDVYARLAFASKNLKTTHDELLTVVQTVNNTLLLSGASAQESASSMIQLSQAFSKGSLDGDEFRSVSEGNVILFGLMQEVLGKSSKELRQFSRDGLFTAEEMLKVMTSPQAAEFQRRVDEMPFTFDQAFTAIRNSLSSLAHDFEDTFSGAAKSIVSGLADISDINRFLSSLEQGLLVGSGFSAFDVFDLDKVRSALSTLDTEMFNLSEKQRIRVAAISNELVDLQDEINEINSSINEMTAGLGDPLPSFTNLFPDEFVEGFERVLDAVSQARLTGLRMELEEAELQVEKLNEEFIKLSSGTNAVQDLRDIVVPETALELALGKYQTALANLQFEYDLLIPKQELLNHLLEIGFINTSVYEKEMKKIETALKGTAEEADNFNKALGVALGNTLAKGVGDVADTIFDFLTGIETSFRDTINNIIEDIGRLVLKMILLNAVKQSLSQTSVGSFLFPSADGNAFNNGRVIPFASGGVIDSPMLFPMANGGTGIAGEAGAEAILPLDRGPDGKLGVKAHGGASERIVVQMENKGTESQVIESTASSDLNGTVISIVLDDLHKGGKLRDSIKGMREY